MPRSRKQAEARLDLQSLIEGASNEDAPLASEGGLGDLIAKFDPYLDGIITTLGLAAQPTKNADGSTTPGDTDAAKKALDFLGKALTGKADTKQKDTLTKIAEIRAKAKSARTSGPA